MRKHEQKCKQVRIIRNGSFTSSQILECDSIKRTNQENTTTIFKCNRKHNGTPYGQLLSLSNNDYWNSQKEASLLGTY